MKKRTYLIPVLLFAALALQAATDVKVMQYKYAGPIVVNKPFMVDTVNVNGKPFEAKNLLKSTLPFDRALSSPEIL